VFPVKAKILFIYPTPFRITGLPIGLASLIAILKDKGHLVKVFDTAFYHTDSDKSQTEIRSERKISKTVMNEDVYLPENKSSMETDLLDVVTSFKPDIIGLSILEIMYDTSVNLCKVVKKEFQDIPLMAGGVFPTLSPEVVTREPVFDIVCIGEGESAVGELADRISQGLFYDTIEGLWVKKDNRVIKNPPSKLHDINTIPFPDFSEFDPRLFYKPMQGKMYKMVNIETSRGCNNDCTYCAAPQLRKFYKENGCGRYNRNMDMKNIIEQIHLQVQRYSPEFIYFSSENFLLMSEENFQTFITEYEKIKLPFWIQTRIETLTTERLLALKKVGMHWLTIGLEHGNEEFRKKVLKRYYTNIKFIKKMDTVKDAGMGASINNVIGFPFETRDLIFETIKMNKILWEKNNKLEINVFLFTPYRGCELYSICREQGLLNDIPFTNSSNMNERSVLNFSEEFQRDLSGLIRTFNLYVKLPEEYNDQIKIAEQLTDEGNAMLKKLTQLIG
jgi:radical SAM superfamily enzyme YgiQ (UPF0313 family)